MTTGEILTTDEIIEALAVAGHELPVQAMGQAVSRWDEIGPILLEKLAAAAGSEELANDDAEILFFGVYLMAQMREQRAFLPLCRLAARPDNRLNHIIGDGITESLAAILTRVYGGDAAPLRQLIEDEQADEFARDAAFDALALLTAMGQLDRDETSRYLGGLYETLMPRSGSFAWVGWQQAISSLALDDLVPLVEAAFRDEWIDPIHLELEDFHADLRAAKAAKTPEDAFVAELARFDDVVMELATWDYFDPKGSWRRLGRRRDRSGRYSDPAPMPHVPVDMTPVRNPLRHVGRNDPCPCGSGKKFKKCCLV
jgi:hypothetical protein